MVIEEFERGLGDLEDLAAQPEKTVDRQAGQPLVGDVCNQPADEEDDRGDR